MTLESADMENSPTPEQIAARRQTAEALARIELSDILDDESLSPIPTDIEPTKDQRIKLLTAVRSALAEYEIRRGREFHMEPRGITQRHVQEFSEAIEARMNEGGS